MEESVFSNIDKDSRDFFRDKFKNVLKRNEEKIKLRKKEKYERIILNFEKWVEEEYDFFQNKVGFSTFINNFKEETGKLNDKNSDKNGIKRERGEYFNLGRKIQRLSKKTGYKCAEDFLKSNVSKEHQKKLENSLKIMKNKIYESLVVDFEEWVEGNYLELVSFNSFAYFYDRKRKRLNEKGSKKKGYGRKRGDYASIPQDFYSQRNQGKLEEGIETTTPSVYSLSFKINISGGYNELVDFLKALENNLRQVYVKNIRLSQARGSENLEVNLDLYTIYKKQQ